MKVDFLFCFKKYFWHFCEKLGISFLVQKSQPQCIGKIYAGCKNSHITSPANKEINSARSIKGINLTPT